MWLLEIGFREEVKERVVLDRGFIEYRVLNKERGVQEEMVVRNVILERQDMREREVNRLWYLNVGKYFSGYFV